MQVGDKIDYMKVVDGLQNLQVSTPNLSCHMTTHWSHGLATSGVCKLTEISTPHDT